MLTYLFLLPLPLHLGSYCPEAQLIFQQSLLYSLAYHLLSFCHILCL
nr:MAG TPA: hypothetical protein [Caudoviricetes sp.]